MADYVLIDGDTAEFEDKFGLATVDVQPGTLTATGEATVGGKKMCIEGDEGSVSVPNCTYKTELHSISGTGTLEISALGGDQVATKTSSAGSAVLLVGSIFTAKFAVTNPAKQPPPGGVGSPSPDPLSEHMGMGSFTTSNKKFCGV